jgi:hypothetical protein
VKFLRILRDAIKYIAAVGPVTLQLLGIKGGSVAGKVVDGAGKIDPILPK